MASAPLTRSRLLEATLVEDRLVTAALLLEFRRSIPSTLIANGEGVYERP